MKPRMPRMELTVRASTRRAPPVHFGHQERAVPIDGLDIADVALRRRGADTHHHDGAGPRDGSLAEAERPRVPPPLGGIAAPGNVALVRDPPGAVAVCEAIGGSRYRPGGRGCAQTNRRSGLWP